VYALQAFYGMHEPDDMALGGFDPVAAVRLRAIERRVGGDDQVAATTVTRGYLPTAFQSSALVCGAAEACTLM
jgi:hypothetical protein